MKGRANKPYTSKTILNAWRQVLENLNRIRPIQRATWTLRRSPK